MRYPKNRNIHRPRHINQQERPYFITGRTYFGLPYFETSETKEVLLQAIGLAARHYALTIDAWVILDNHYHLLFRPPGVGAPEGITNKFVTSKNETTPLGVARPFSIGKVVGTIHGRSSSLLKKITDKSVTTSGNDNFSCYYDWWNAKYWEASRERNIKLYGPRSVLAEKRRSREFLRLLSEGTPLELVEFVRRTEKVWYQYTDHIIRDQRDYFMHFNYIHQNAVKHGFTRRMSKYEFSSIHDWVKEKGKEWAIDCFRKYPIIDFEPEMDDFD